MSGVKFLLDTNIIIGLLNRHANRGKLPDAIVAATAQVHQLTLITLDQQLKTKL